MINNQDKVYTPFVSNPNQKICTVHKRKYKTEGVKFMYIGLEEIRLAAQRLSPSGFKLYLFFAENEDEFKFYFSPKDFQKKYNVAESTCRKAKQELIANGYIVEREHNNFDFYPNPHVAEISIDDLRKELIRVAEHIKEYDVDAYNSFGDRAAQLKDLDEIEKKVAGISLLKDMKQKLEELEIANSTFKF